MNKTQLALELKRRQYDLDEVEREMIDALADDEIIDCYITCSCCGERQVDERNLEKAIARARNADDFLRICNDLSKPHSHPELRLFPEDSSGSGETSE